MKSYVKNCVLVPKIGENVFLIDGDNIYPLLDGYAIIPVDRYDQLLNLERQRQISDHCSVDEHAAP